MRTKNELLNFEEEFFKKVREKDAWKNISQNKDLPWDKKFIEMYADKLDWEELCANRGIKWNEELIEKFRRYIDWEVLSENILQTNTQYYSTCINWNLLKKHERFWNWTELSRTLSFVPIEVIEQYAANWDWKELIHNRHINWTYELFERFKNYIPVSDFESLQRSELWDNLVRIDEQIITGKILAG